MRPKIKKTPSSERKLQAVMDDTQFIENLKKEAFIRGIDTLPKATKRAIELGFAEILKMPIVPARVDHDETLEVKK